MKRYIVNVRGINASGKSTAVRAYCQEHNMSPRELIYRGEKYRFMTNGKECALGWYKPYSNSEGLDSLRQDKEDFKNFFEFFLDEEQPRIVVYEKQIWSTTYKLTREISEIAGNHGYEFLAVCMRIKYETALNRLFLRNGGKMTNLDAFDKRFYATQRSRLNLMRGGITVIDADIEKITKEKMGGLIERALEMYDSSGGTSYGLIQYTE